MGELFGMIIAGAIIGGLARLFMKGEQNIGMIWTIILGALGCGIASFILARVWPSVMDTAGVDWIRWIVSIICAIGCISVYLAITNRKNK